MDVERVAVTVRPRAGLEAVDLGVRMARTWALPLFGAHALVVVAIALLAHGLFRNQPLAALFAIWWLKPLGDRVALAVISEAFFGDVPSLSAVLGRLPMLITRSGLFSALTWRRLSPVRTLLLPVTQLEGLRGDARRTRERVLVARQSSVALGAFSACALFELIAMTGIAAFLSFFAPEGAKLSWLQALALGETPVVHFTQSAAYVLTIALVEPLFVAMGFALYVNRRVWLEGWDLDLAFRRLDRRLRARAAPVLGVALLLALCGPAAGARAEEPEALHCEAQQPEQAALCAEKVLALPEFEGSRKITTWTWRESSTRSEASEPGAFGAFLAELFALGLRAAVLLAVAGLVIALAIAVLRRLEVARPRPIQERATPVVRGGLDLRPSALPDDVIAAARARHAAGDVVGALSLLYRGVLVRCVAGRGARLPASATEGECERIARPLLASDEVQLFAALTRDWMGVAYARGAVAASEFEAHCAAWAPRVGGAAT